MKLIRKSKIWCLFKIFRTEYLVSCSFLTPRAYILDIYLWDLWAIFSIIRAFRLSVTYVLRDNLWSLPTGIFWPMDSEFVEYVKFLLIDVFNGDELFKLLIPSYPAYFKEKLKIMCRFTSGINPNYPTGSYKTPNFESRFQG